MAQLPMHSIGCTGCTAKTPNCFDNRGDDSVRVRFVRSSDGTVWRTVLCDHCARFSSEIR